jgi:copper(I)-binding protein
MMNPAFARPLAALLFAFGLASAAPAQDSTGHDSAGHSHEEAEHGAMAHLGDIAISGAFTRATLPNAPVVGGYLTITNTGDNADRLVSASAPIAQETQIHEMALEGDVMKMRQIKDGLDIPAGESVALTPGGYHLMFMGLNSAVAEGDNVPVTLTFEHAGTITMDLIAAGTSASAPDAHAGH